VAESGSHTKSTNGSWKQHGTEEEAT